MRFSAPAYTEVVRYRVWRSVRLTSAERYFFSPTETVPGGDEEWALDRCGGLSNTCTAVGSPSDPLGAGNLLDRTPPNPLSKWGFYLSCGRYRSDDTDCRATSPISAEATMWRSETTLLDDDWPAFPAAPAGSLLDGGTLSGLQRVSTIATDKGGGIASTALEVDGQVVTSATFGDTAGNCRAPYTTRVPCPGTASGTLTLDTAQLGDGAHRLRVLATDAAGNTSAWGPATIVTDNAQALCAPAPTPAGTPLKLRTWIAAEPQPHTAKPKPKGKAKKKGKQKSRAATVSAGASAPAPASAGAAASASASATAAAARRGSVTVAMGRATVVSGELTDAVGTPVGGGAVCVSARVGDGGALTPLARLTTDSGGRFSARIPAGTSRQVWSVLRVAGGAVTAKAIVRVRAQLSLKPTRRSVRAGKVLRMRGVASPAARSRAGGVLVNIQAKRGREWQTFRQVRVHGSGRFTVRYRFVGGGGTRCTARDRSAAGRIPLRAGWLEAVPRARQRLSAPAAARLPPRPPPAARRPPPAARRPPPAARRPPPAARRPLTMVDNRRYGGRRESARRSSHARSAGSARFVELSFAPTAADPDAMRIGYGGDVANVLVMAARLGAAARLAGRVGDDGFEGAAARLLGRERRRRERCASRRRRRHRRLSERAAGGRRASLQLLAARRPAAA